MSLQRNGNLQSMNSQSVSNNNTFVNQRSNTGDDVDIQILQQKKQQAEIKRLVYILNGDLLLPW